MISKLCAKAEVDKFQYGIYEDIFRKNGWIPGFIILRPVSGLSVCPVVCPAVPHNNSVSRSPVRGSPPCPPLTVDQPKPLIRTPPSDRNAARSEEHTSDLQ